MQLSQLSNMQAPMMNFNADKLTTGLQNLPIKHMVNGTPEKLTAFQNLSTLEGLDVQTMTPQQM